MNRRRLIGILIVLALLVLIEGQSFAESVRTITLNPKISKDVEGFPALIKFNDENIFSTAMAHGEDLVFFDGAKRRLPFEIVCWDAEKNFSEIWIRVPIIRSARSTKVAFHYGGNNIPENAGFRGYRSSEVWGDDFDLVLHANQLSDHVKSSAGASSGSPADVVLSSEGVVGNSFTFDGDNSSIQLHDLQHVDRWMTPVEKFGEYEMRRPQGMANDGRHLYFASHNDPKPADILKISIASGKRLKTFLAAGPLHSGGGDYWGKNRTLVFSTGGNSNAAGLQEITLAGAPIRYWNLSKVGYGTGALCAWKGRDRWLLFTSRNSRFKITEVELRRDGSFRVIDQWIAPVALGIPQGMDYFDGHVFYYTDGGRREPALINKLKLDPRREEVQYVDQHAILINNHEAEGLTILDNGTVFAGDVKNEGVVVGEVFKVGNHVDDFVSTFKDFTISVWFKQSEAGRTKYPTLIAKGSSLDNRNAFILHTMNVGADSLTVKFGMTAPQWFGIISEPVTKDSWHHAVGVYDHAAGFEFYLDGALVGRRPHTIQHTIVDHRVPATIGVDIESGQRAHFYPGLIDEIRISKSTSSASRIKATYQNIANYDDFVKIGPERTVSAR